MPAVSSAGSRSCLQRPSPVPEREGIPARVTEPCPTGTGVSRCTFAARARAGGQEVSAALPLAELFCFWACRVPRPAGSRVNADVPGAPILHRAAWPPPETARSSLAAPGPPLPALRFQTAALTSTEIHYIKSSGMTTASNPCI
ncbi:hypothetical protein NDU88_000748 [Pleurodeles waltl]|uniref:Uncharacterized protein n=1 Tax=Pleurodeles waltl TaxID=8319 RepID=A0AAV7L7J1_PLEWA|nr:hypothetical protein NDU88_000748 [Pleurodeles waltl]